MEHEMKSSTGRANEKEEEVAEVAGDGEGETGSEEDDGINNLHIALTQVTDKMKENLEVILERESKLEDLTQISHELEGAGKHFKTVSKDVSETYKRKNMKMVIGIVAAVVFLVIIIIVVISLIATGVIPVGKIPIP